MTEPTTARHAMDDDFAAMESAAAMLATYLGPVEADMAANDVIAKLRLGGFTIRRAEAAQPADSRAGHCCEQPEHYFPNEDEE